eukprot:CAMPEP_0194036300 /NCGR_PEP_ID=MMETSP0009_2-20130614/8646_1 /TAXON_ID=210454 /ORGANISM="Grammatophora oceanica, Strain CCMP 410" /LENGTH=122 /DNA_ID=CAMNT_0038677977 /DNA_START=87 /DNA_END=452 /DNA_ORIENTATION=-
MSSPPAFMLRLIAFLAVAISLHAATPNSSTQSGLYLRGHKQHSVARIPAATGSQERNLEAVESSTSVSTDDSESTEGSESSESDEEDDRRLQESLSSSEDSGPSSEESSESDDEDDRRLQES